jgi:hypothetical protein
MNNDVRYDNPAVGPFNIVIVSVVLAVNIPSTVMQLNNPGFPTPENSDLTGGASLKTRESLLGLL